MSARQPESDGLADARDAIRRGSSSFAAAARLLAPDVRDDARLLYAWCRHCDDEVDGQRYGRGAAGRDDPREAAARLDAVRAATVAVLRGEPARDAPHRALAAVLARRAIDPALPLEHLEGYAMDVAGTRYETPEALRVYCRRVAGVVGEMMAGAMGARDAATLARASDLGLAFQMTNIARDVVDDARAGRIYLPAGWLRDAGLPTEPARLVDPALRARLVVPVARLLDASEPLYASARIGLRALPPRCAWAVGTALGAYRAIGIRVRAAGPRAWDARASTTRLEKAWHAVAAMPGAVRAVPWRGAAAPPRRDAPARHRDGARVSR
jgi:phytoene synthase